MVLISQGFLFFSSNSGPSLRTLSSTLWASFSLLLKLLPTLAMWSLLSQILTFFLDTNFQRLVFFSSSTSSWQITRFTACLLCLFVFLSISNRIFWGWGVGWGLLKYVQSVLRPEVGAKLFHKQSLLYILTQVSAMSALQMYCCVQLLKHKLINLRTFMLCDKHFTV